MNAMPGLRLRLFDDPVDDQDRSSDDYDHDSKEK
jgi:hypothetical protein